MKQALLIFAKNLIHGKVKTRLANTIGNDAAMNVYKHLLQHTASVTDQLPVHKILFYSDSIETNDAWSDKKYVKQIQSGNDLGERMRHAFENAFAKGNKEVVIIGTDCLEISTDIITKAFTHLKNSNVVIGPAKDGGYYLAGMKQLHAPFFININWSTSEVLQQTLDICKHENLSVHLLPVLSDIDTEQDLSEAQKQLFQTNQRER
ncbi:TIGR04282 family arsenosugar biosynthesis glycosyltransferase [Ferruginibacter paludis]|uniref:TIGR04282 family arsenosugar biosynthesis glycosyltransferase n=1 Tax=Ferruginibacter paludis TaxID=1310417 RepID=UPI0025B46C85|nr:TIGR04282 family arsenosugar biosynthesis glycosyltransferase [Ferruginibacter paludis]MDN3656671.1 TIGR04282 family arsenosugar biosynthesis glycosyltransferase [Ferruginibacter paludis]